MQGLTKRSTKEETDSTDMEEVEEVEEEEGVDSDFEISKHLLSPEIIRGFFTI